MDGHTDASIERMQEREALAAKVKAVAYELRYGREEGDVARKLRALADELEAL